MDQARQAAAIIFEVPYATVASADTTGKPWNTPVFAAYDRNANFYWSSTPEAVHSTNIEQRPEVFIVIYDSRAAKGEGRAVYIEAKVKCLTDIREIRSALDLLGRRSGRPFADLRNHGSSGPQRIYKAIPLSMWLNQAEHDEQGDIIRDFRVEVPVAEVRSEIS